MSPDVQMQWGVLVPLRDGIRLSATVYTPLAGTAPYPALFVMTPYVGQTYHDQALYFAAHGYAFLTVDVRGRGNSEGEFHPINEARDSHDVIEWLAAQSYCNGKVAMWGGSYSGYVQWAAIKELSARLTTIVPVAAPCRAVDSPMRNNIFAPYSIQWLTLVSGRTSQDKIFFENRAFWSGLFRRWYESGRSFKELDSFAGNPSALFQEWISHPQQGEYWDRYNPSAEEYGAVTIPVLTVTGIYDANQPGSLTHYREHMRNASTEARAKHYLVIGPWDHAGTRIPKAQFGGLCVGHASLLDVRKLHLDWYAWVMRGGPKPEFLQRSVAYYVMAADKWRYADSLDAITSHSMPLHLSSRGKTATDFLAGRLGTEPAGSGEPHQYVYDPRDLSRAELESGIDPDALTDQRMVRACVGKQLVYHSDPFENDTEVSGFCKLVAWLSIDQPDTDFRAWLYEIDPSGGSTLLTTDSMRARYRESLREAKLIRTADPLRYELDRFTFVSRLVRKGHRLRLVIGPINSIYSQRNYNGGGVVAEESMVDARPVTVRLFHDDRHASALYLPIGHPEV